MSSISLSVVPSVCMSLVLPLRTYPANTMYGQRYWLDGKLVKRQRLLPERYRASFNFIYSRISRALLAIQTWPLRNVGRSPLSLHGKSSKNERPTIGWRTTVEDVFFRKQRFQRTSCLHDQMLNYRRQTSLANHRSRCQDDLPELFGLSTFIKRWLTDSWGITSLWLFVCRRSYQCRWVYIYPGRRLFWMCFLTCLPKCRYLDHFEGTGGIFLPFSTGIDLVFWRRLAL